VASIRKRVFPRKYGAELVLWLANWRGPKGNKLSRGFPTRAEAEAWLGRIAADPSLGYGPRLADIRREDTRARALRMLPPGRIVTASSTEEEEALSAPASAVAVGRNKDAALRELRRVSASLTRLADAVADIRELRRRDVTALERLTGLVEDPRAPKISRRRPLE
jgi:hypothetical protein